MRRCLVAHTARSPRLSCCCVLFTPSRRLRRKHLARWAADRWLFRARYRLAAVRKVLARRRQLLARAWHAVVMHCKQRQLEKRFLAFADRTRDRFRMRRGLLSLLRQRHRRGQMRQVCGRECGYSRRVIVNRSFCRRVSLRSSPASPGVTEPSSSSAAPFSPSAAPCAARSSCVTTFFMYATSWSACSPVALIH